MSEFSEVIRNIYDIKNDEDESKIIALHKAFGGIESDPLDFAGAIHILHNLGWHHESEGK